MVVVFGPLRAWFPLAHSVVVRGRRFRCARRSFVTARRGRRRRRSGRTTAGSAAIASAAAGDANHVAATIVQQIGDAILARMEYVRLADRLDGAVVVAQPVRVAAVVGIDDVVALRSVLAVVIDNGEQTVLLLLLAVLLR